MEFSPPPRRPRSESIVPMINVVFLLLIFFLMTSRLAEPEPFDVTPPEATHETEPSAEPVLFISADNKIHFDGAEGEAAIARLAAQTDPGATLQIRADAALEAKALATVLRDLAAAGLARAELVVRQP
ncbi:biopolymer transporter ExbD [Phaeobacter sp.]|uniref:ExbD/TolR family protein n=1 Tax=Phaeobacter sp. TaxID=1902409 RepID=UPI0025E1FA9D|nr:biopolymer transporter ExbD [Phaeobacter sp.]